MSAMGTPTLLRVKRLRTADPSEMIVIKAKKRRAEEDEGEGRGEDFKILKLATTVDEKGDSSKLNEAVTKILAKKTAPRSYEELKEPGVSKKHQKFIFEYCFSPRNLI